jgi:FkbM family methyltransferase
MTNSVTNKAIQAVVQAGKNLIRRSPFLPIAKKAQRFYLRFVGKRHHIQDTETAEGYDLVNLGTEYGGWTLVNKPSLEKSIILSAGLGEDASFDVEFANTYDSKVIIMDPTPRAVQHFEDIQNRIGKMEKQPYAGDGKESVEAYDLSNIDRQQLSLVKKALWNENTEMEFYKPEVESHVSHSLINWQHDYSNDTEYIQVQADTIFSILDSQDINKSEIELVKLDIEGAEIEVLLQMLEEDFYPKQILVEFDELHNPSDRGFKRVDQAHGMLLVNGYELIYTDGMADFLYIKKE